MEYLRSCCQRVDLSTSPTVFLQESEIPYVRHTPYRRVFAVLELEDMELESMSRVRLHVLCLVKLNLQMLSVFGAKLRAHTRDLARSVNIHDLLAIWVVRPVKFLVTPTA